MNLLLLAAKTPPDDLVTPGPIGFAVIAVIGVVSVLLIIDMVRRVRRVTYRAIVREQLAMEAAEAAAAEGATTEGTADASPEVRAPAD